MWTFKTGEHDMQLPLKKPAVERGRWSVRKEGRDYQQERENGDDLSRGRVVGARGLESTSIKSRWNTDYCSQYQCEVRGYRLHRGHQVSRMLAENLRLLGWRQTAHYSQPSSRHHANFVPVSPAPSPTEQHREGSHTELYYKRGLQS
jgi:hypothetical protein